MRTILRVIASVLIGLLLLIPLAAVYGAANLPVYHSWELMHGSFATAIPALVAASFVALGLVPWFGRATDVLPRLISCMSVLALVTVLFWVDQRSQFSMSLLHLIVYAALFVLFTFLCFHAKQPLLLPLFLLVPLLTDPLFGLLIPGGFNAIGMEIFGHDLLYKLLPPAVACGLAVVLIRLLRAREV